MIFKKNILITGATGLLGRGMEETMSEDFNIIGIHRRDYSVKDSKILHLSLDVQDRLGLERLFDTYKFETAIHAAGIANVDYVQKNYKQSRVSNIIGTANMVDVCRVNHCKLIYISTNAVFDGKAAPYSEHDPVSPVNTYGQLKVDCEKLVREGLEQYAIARPICMYGWNHLIARQNFATFVYSKLMKGETISMVNDVYENPLFNLSCGEALWKMVARNTQGIVHLAGAQRVNRYEFALAVAQAFNLDANLVKEVDSSFFPSIAPRPKDSSFYTHRMEEELGVKALTIDEGFTMMKEQMKCLP